LRDEATDEEDIFIGDAPAAITERGGR